MDYLKKILCPLIELIISKNEIIEVDPEKIGVSEVPQNSEKLKTTTQNFLTEILNSKNSFPL